MRVHTPTMSFPRWTSAAKSRRSAQESAKLRSLRVEALHIITLCVLVYSQKALATEAKNAWFYVPERMQPFALVILALEVCLVIPAMIVVAEWVFQLFSLRLRYAAHSLVLFVLLALFVFQTLQRLTDLSIVLLLIVSGIAGVAGTLVYLSTYPVRLFLTYLSIAVVAIPASFLTRSAAAPLVFPGDEPNATAVTVGNPVPVVELVFDEFPLVSLLDGQQQIDAGRYPNFGRLAHDSYWFRNATTVADYTRNAVPAILTGQYPDYTLLPTAQDHPQNLFTLLGGSYEMHVTEPITHLCPQSICNEPEPSFTDQLEQVHEHMFHVPEPEELSSPDRVDGFYDFLASLDDTSDQSLHFDHVEVPHVPWDRLPSGQLYTVSTEPRVPGELPGHWANDEWLTTQAYQRHLLQVGYVDQLLGKLIDRLQEVGLYDRALVIVTADHGANFQPDLGRRSFSYDTAQAIMPVPLFIKLPHQDKSVVSDENVQSIDILPTIADVLDVQLPWSVDGQSVFDTSKPRPTFKLLLGQGGGRYEVGATVDGVQEAVERKIAIFGTGSDSEDLYRIGKYAGLVEQREEGVVSGSEAGMQVRLDQPDAFSHVDPSSPLIPALITGKLSGSHLPKGDVYLAIAVNGEIQAVTRTYRQDGAVNFAAMVPPESFRAGENSVDVLRITGSESAPQVAHLQQVVDGS